MHLARVMTRKKNYRTHAVRDDIARARIVLARVYIERSLYIAPDPPTRRRVNVTEIERVLMYFSSLKRLIIIYLARMMR